ncbi:MAG: FeoB-associated Cys-rich membrane protein [Clostridia bacterium]|nr:FeoB-associated Cys-rich membrane protein [Clostridia bacterium]
MEPIDIIVIAVICLIIGGASAYIIKAKKSGKKCIGCPDSASCHSKKKASDSHSCCSSCSTCSSCCSSCSSCKTDSESDEGN